MSLNVVAAAIRIMSCPGALSSTSGKKKLHRDEWIPACPEVMAEFQLPGRNLRVLGPVYFVFCSTIPTVISPCEHGLEGGAEG